MKPSLVLIIHNIRSCHNVGSLLRTAEGIGVSKVYLTGITPYPLTNKDSRLPHIAQKLHKQIQKTALGAETTLDWEHEEDISGLIARLKTDGYVIGGLEQTANSTPLPEYRAPAKFALIVGNEVEGLDTQTLESCDVTLEIPMFGEKESYNVVQAAAMALYQVRFMLQ